MKAHKFHDLLRERMQEKGYGGKEICVYFWDNPITPTDIIWSDDHDCFIIKFRTVDA